MLTTVNYLLAVYQYNADVEITLIDEFPTKTYNLG